MERCDCCGSIIKIGDISSFLKTIREIIERDNLDVPSRSRPKNHRRYYLYNQMRHKGMTLQQIGEYFSRDHATILHGLKMHNTYFNNNDTVYLKDTEEYDNLFQINK